MYREKAALRRQLTAVRTARPPADIARARTALATRITDLIAGMTRVCMYLPLRTEPLDRQLLDSLDRTATVLLPIARPAGLDWAIWDGRRRRSAVGVDEPTGPPLGYDAICTAQAIIVPALAADRAGYRLGRGGGYYDRALALAGPGPMRLAVIFDDELLDAVPVAPWDMPVTHVLTPQQTLVI